MKQNQLVEHQTTDSKPNQDYIGHTPGPWDLVSADVEDRSAYIVLSEAENTDIAYVGCEGEIREIAHANARLISAAPDLLEACKLAMTQRYDCEVYEKISAAIAKAEGKQ
jgi:hypothetical protein